MNIGIGNVNVSNTHDLIVENGMYITSNENATASKGDGL